MTSDRLTPATTFSNWRMDTRGSAPEPVIQNFMLSADIRNTIAFEIGFAVPEVEAVFVSIEENVLHVWSVVPERDRTVYRKIYAAEKDLIQRFQHVGFDFNVISSGGKNPRTLLRDPGLELAYSRAIECAAD